MGWGKDLLDIGKTINDARRKYKKEHDKDAYIQLMEDQLDDVYDKLIEAYKKLDAIEESGDFVLKPIHKEVFDLFGVEHKIETEILLEKVRSRPELEIAYQELVDKGYFIFYSGYFAEDGVSRATWNHEKKTEILKFTHGK